MWSVQLHEVLAPLDTTAMLSVLGGPLSSALATPPLVLLAPPLAVMLDDTPSQELFSSRDSSRNVSERCMYVHACVDICVCICACVCECVCVCVIVCMCVC
jgi:hypothetical protein